MCIFPQDFKNPWSGKSGIFSWKFPPVSSRFPKNTISGHHKNIESSKIACRRVENLKMSQENLKKRLKSGKNNFQICKCCPIFKISNVEVFLPDTKGMCSTEAILTKICMSQRRESAPRVRQPQELLRRCVGGHHHEQGWKNLCQILNLKISNKKIKKSMQLFDVRSYRNPTSCKTAARSNIIQPCRTASPASKQPPCP